MSTQDQNNNFNQPRRDGRVIAGLFLLAIGAVFILKEIHFMFFPGWLFTWPMILIVIGIYSGLKHQFRNMGWLIPIVIGGIFLFDEMGFDYDLHRFIAPAIIITVGLTMILRPRRNRNWNSNEAGQWKDEKTNSYSTGPVPNYSPEDFFDSTAVFGSAKKVIISKNFKGGDITCFMGGCEIDLTQADMTQPAVIDLTFVFGGGKIIVPSDWQVNNNITPVFGGIEDKRRQPMTLNPNKVLIIRGTCLFGGLEIKNY